MMYLEKTSRRSLLKNGAALSLAGALPSIASLANAQASSGNDYRALVCFFMGGGDDAHNTVLSTDPETWKNYVSARPLIAHEKDTLLRIEQRYPTGLNVGREFALHPQLTFHKKMWDEGYLAIVPNVGPLIQPTTREDIAARRVRLPGALGAHNHQRAQWQCLAPKVVSEGWGGKISEYFDNGAYQELCSMRLDTGGWSQSKNVKPFSLIEDMNVKFSALSDGYLNGLQVDTLKNVVFGNSNSPFVKDWQKLLLSSIELNGILNERATSVSLKPANGYQRKFRTLLQGMTAAKSLGIKRQVFFIYGPGGYDSHGDVVDRLKALYSDTSYGLTYFYEQLQQNGLLDQVTLFTASDFGRTLKSNGPGSDHGWGGHHYVFGGAVKGGSMYGRFPDVGLGTRDDSGNGALIPSISVEQYGATLAKWMGLSDSQLLEVFPNLANFDEKNLGFMRK